MLRRETNLKAQQDKGITSLKNTALDLQTQLATVSSEKRQLELRLQQSQSSLNEALQTRDTRLSEAAVEKEELIKAREDLEAAQRTVAKLRQKQDQYLSSTAATNMSGSEQQVREEREKLLVSLENVPSNSRNFSAARAAISTLSNRSLPSAITLFAKSK